MDELKTLETLGLTIPSVAYIVGALVFGIIGYVGYRYGKKASLKTPKWIGIALMLYPYAISEHGSCMWWQRLVRGAVRVSRVTWPGHERKIIIKTANNRPCRSADVDHRLVRHWRKAGGRAGIQGCLSLAGPPGCLWIDRCRICFALPRLAWPYIALIVAGIGGVHEFYELPPMATTSNISMQR